MATSKWIALEVEQPRRSGSEVPTSWFGRVQDKICPRWSSAQRSLCICLLLLVLPLLLVLLRAGPTLLRDLKPLPHEMRAFEEHDVDVEFSELDMWDTPGDAAVDDAWVNTVHLHDCTVRLSNERLVVAQRVVGSKDEFAVRFVVAVPDVGKRPHLRRVISGGAGDLARELLKGDILFERSSGAAAAGVVVLKLGQFNLVRDMQLKIPTSHLAAFEKAFEWALSGQGKAAAAAASAKAKTPTAPPPPLAKANVVKAAAAPAAVAPAAAAAATAAAAVSAAPAVTEWRCNCPPSFAVVACNEAAHRAIVSGASCPFYAAEHARAAAAAAAAAAAGAGGGGGKRRLR